MKHRMMMTALGLSVVLAAGVVRADKPAALPAGKEKETNGLSLAEFEKLHKELQLKSQPWATIPWKLSLTEARQQAAREKKPIFLMTGTGHLLCLG